MVDVWTTNIEKNDDMLNMWYRKKIKYFKTVDSSEKKPLRPQAQKWLSKVGWLRGEDAFIVHGHTQYSRTIAFWDASASGRSKFNIITSTLYNTLTTKRPHSYYTHMTTWLYCLPPAMVIKQQSWYILFRFQSVGRVSVTAAPSYPISYAHLPVFRRVDNTS